VRYDPCLLTKHVTDQAHANSKQRFDPCYLPSIKAEPSIPLTVLAGIQTPDVADIAHEELTYPYNWRS